MVAPSSAKCRAMRLPTPRLAPVTNATRPFRRIGLLHSRFYRGFTTVAESPRASRPCADCGRSILNSALRTRIHPITVAKGASPALRGNSLALKMRHHLFGQQLDVMPDLADRYSRRSD